MTEEPPRKPDRDTTRLEKKSPKQTWQEFLKTLEGSLPFISAILAKEKLPEFSGSDITIQLTGSAFDLNRIESKRHEMETLAGRYYGEKINFILKKNGENQAVNEKSPARLRQELLNHPLVSDAIELFNGTIIDINTKEF